MHCRHGVGVRRMDRWTQGSGVSGSTVCLLRAWSPTRLPPTSTDQAQRLTPYFTQPSKHACLPHLHLHCTCFLRLPVVPSSTWHPPRRGTTAASQGTDRGSEVSTQSCADTDASITGQTHEHGQDPPAWSSPVSHVSFACYDEMLFQHSATLTHPRRVRHNAAPQPPRKRTPSKTLPPRRHSIDRYAHRHTHVQQACGYRGSSTSRRCVATLQQHPELTLVHMHPPPYPRARAQVPRAVTRLRPDSGYGRGSGSPSRLRKADNHAQSETVAHSAPRGSSLAYSYPQ